MSTNTLPTEPEWLVTSRKAAYCARRRLNGADLSPQDMEDMIQAATLAYWKHHREGRPIPFCFVCARQAAQKYFYRKIRGRNPLYPLSLDASLDDTGDLPHEWLLPSTATDDNDLRLDWLSDEVLEGVLFEARQAAGFSQRMLNRYWDTIQTDKVLLRSQIIRLAANGHTNASIAELMGTTEGTIRNRERRSRRRIRRLLESLLPLDALVEYDRSGGNQERAREIQLTYPDQQKPVPAQ
jgi:DNA-directed RNA polymerase specialized sigma24 family protein